MTRVHIGPASAGGRLSYRSVCSISADPSKRTRAAYGEVQTHLALVEIDARVRRAFAHFAIVHRRSESEWLVTADHVAIERVVAGVESLAGPQVLSIGGVSQYVGVSVGLAADEVQNVTTPANLLREADAALVTAIAEGLPVVVGNHAQVEAIRADQGLATRIVESTDADFRPYYQPIVALPSGKVAGQEMVLRWRTSDDDWGLPHDFMAVANETGRILSIGSRMMGDAMAEHLAAWAQSPDMPFLSVNLSRRQMMDPDLVHQISEAITRNGMPADKLWIEVSEKQIIDLRGQALTTVEELRRLGCVICVDDLGVGYSALSYLWDLPVGVVKLDRSLIHGLLGGSSTWMTFVDCICTLATTAGAAIVAEGVEDPAVLPALNELGIGYAQGFHFGPPIPAPTVAEAIAAQQDS